MGCVQSASPSRPVKTSNDFLLPKQQPNLVELASPIIKTNLPESPTNTNPTISSSIPIENPLLISEPNTLIAAGPVQASSSQSNSTTPTHTFLEEDIMGNAPGRAKGIMKSFHSPSNNNNNNNNGGDATKTTTLKQNTSDDRARPPTVPPVLTSVVNPNLEVLQTDQQVAAQIKEIERNYPRKTSVSSGRIATFDEQGRPFSLVFAHVSQTGFYPDDLQKMNQDTCFIVPNFGSGESSIGGHSFPPPKPHPGVPLNVNPAQTHFFGVYDGHGKDGDLCSTFAEQVLAEELLNSEAYSSGNIERGLHDAFIKTNDLMHEQERKGRFSDMMSGTTSIVGVVNGRSLYIANVGDSRAIVAVRRPGVATPNPQRKTGSALRLMIGKLRAEPLSIDQTPFREDERNRVKAAGARVLTMDQIEGYRDPNDQAFGTEEDDDGDPPRLWCPDGAYPGTAFTRSIGDQIAERIGVFAEPELLVRELSPEDDFFLLASDGVFEFLSSQAVADIICQYDDPLEACRAVVAESYRLWLQYEVRTDDITLILVRIEGLLPIATTTNQSIPSTPKMKHLAHGEVRPVRRNLSRVKADAVGQVSIDPTELDGYVLPVYPKDEEESLRIKAAVRANFLFRHLNEEQLEKAVLAMETCSVNPGQVIIRQFDEGDKFYIADSGEYDVQVAVPKMITDAEGKQVPIVGEYEVPKVVFTYDCKHGTNPCFGELALMYSKPRAASVIATQPGRLWALERKAFRSIIMKTSARRLMQILRKVEVLKPLATKDLSRLADLMTEEVFEPGQYIVKQGDAGDSFYIIMQGRAEVTKVEKAGDVPTKVMDLTENMYFGERALLHDVPRAANVIAVGTSKVKCLSIHRHDFEEVLGSSKSYIEQHRAERERNAGLVSMNSQTDISTRRQLWDKATIADFHVFSASESEVGSLRLFGAISARASVPSTKLMALRVGNKVSMLRESGIDLAIRELEVLKHLNSEPTIFVPDFLSAFQDNRLAFVLLDSSIVMDIASVMGKPLPIETISYIGYSVLLAVEYLHERDYISRSVVPESLAVTDLGRIQLLDFRFAKQVLEEKTFTICGMPEYMSPEQVSGVGHAFEADWWSLGILVFEAATGATPFGGDGKNEITIYSAISNFDGNFSFIPSSVPSQVQSFVRATLEPSKTKRLGCSSNDALEIRSHELFSGLSLDLIVKNPSPLLSSAKQGYEAITKSSRITTVDDFPNISDEVLTPEQNELFKKWV